MHTLILGAGYAGLRAALDLSKHAQCHQTPVQVTLIERNLYHQHVVLLHLAAAGAYTPSDVAIPLDTLLRRRDVRLHQGEVVRIVAPERQVVLRDGLTLSYDRLVIALGAETNYAGVEGAAEHTWPLRSYLQARRLYDHIVDCFREAAHTSDPAARKELLTFVVVGGGFTGCQLAGELTERARALCRDYGIASREVRVALVERSGLLLKMFGEWASGEGERVLRQRGVSIHLNMAVERVEARKLVVTGGKVIRAATIVWAAGIRAPRLLEESGLTTDEMGRVMVDRFLRAMGPGQSEIFAAGDCARIPDEWDQPVPADASYAMRQGEHLGEALLAECAGRTPHMYTPQRLGHLVSLGPGEAIGDPLGVQASGPPVALLKQAVDQWYLTTLWH
jgi:NADH dehydrogenase